MITFEQENAEQFHPLARVKVIGVGGAGGNQINSMIESHFDHVDFIAINTDAQALKPSKAPFKIQIGTKSTKGIGAGANPEAGRRAAEEDIEQVLHYAQGADIVFLLAGMGGGTGSGAMPVVARALKDRGILTIAVVTKPFCFEGRRRMATAEAAIEQLRKEVDTLIVIPNEKLLGLATQDVSLLNAFDMINQIINQFVRSITDIIIRPGHINVDFADLKAIMQNMGLAVIGTGRASGLNRAEQAAINAISSPLLENISISGARSILINISGNASLGLHEVSHAASIIQKQAHEDANIILGSVIDASLNDELLVTVIATGFVSEPMLQPSQRATAQAYSTLPQEPIKQAAYAASAPAPIALEPAHQQVAAPVHHTTLPSVNAPEQSISTQAAAIKTAEAAAQQAASTEVDLQDLEIPALLRRLAREQHINKQ